MPLPPCLLRPPPSPPLSLPPHTPIPSLPPQELFIAILILGIFGCFVFELAAASPVWSDVAWGLVPKAEVVTNPEMLFVAIGILGATVMPHVRPQGGMGGGGGG